MRARLLGILWAWLLRLQAATWRVRREGTEELDRAFAEGRGLLIGMWHGKYVPLFVLLRRYEGVAFTSRSRRGRVIAEICRNFGYRSVELPDRGREASLELMRRALPGEPAGGIVVDGPLGPPRVVKRGIVVLAAEQGRLVFPASVAADRKRVVEGRWDRMLFPRLFSRVALVVGPPIEIPPDLAGEGEELWIARVKTAMDTVDSRAEALVT